VWDPGDLFSYFVHYDKVVPKLSKSLLQDPHSPKEQEIIFFSSVLWVHVWNIMGPIPSRPVPSRPPLQILFRGFLYIFGTNKQRNPLDFVLSYLFSTNRQRKKSVVEIYYIHGHPSTMGPVFFFVLLFWGGFRNFILLI
jgi:hypothetical protein